MRPYIVIKSTIFNLHLSDCAAEGFVEHKEGGGPEEDEGKPGVWSVGEAGQEVEPRRGQDGCADNPCGAEYPTGR